MAIKVSKDIKITWANLRVLVAKATNFTRGQEVSRGLGGTTLQSSIAEAIVELDTSMGDPLATLGASSTVVADSVPVLDEEGRPIEGVTAEVLSGRGKGKLQKIQDLELLFFGDGGDNVGLFDQIEALDDVEL